MSNPIGFLSVKRHPDHGYFGGYLIVNPLARPIEFHCTMPVCPSRAQKLLYGATLEDFLCGEQIATAMYEKAKLKPKWVFTDCRAVLSAARVLNANFAYLDTDQQTRDHELPLENPLGNLATRTLQASETTAHVAEESSSSAEDFQQCLAELAAHFDLYEPFQRITEALLEAHPIAKAA